jgi:hypothetical protein
MSYDAEAIQPGWTVIDANGDEVGTVVEADAQTMRVKKGGFLGGEVTVPRDAVSEVETGHVELSLAKGDLH